MATTASTISVAARLNRLPITPTHRRVTFIIGVGLFFEFYDFFLVSFLSSAIARDFHIRNGSPLQSLLIAATPVGMFFGAIGLNYMADRVGRRRAFLLNLGIYSIFSLLGAFSPNVTVLIITRLIAGIGIGAELPLCDSYLSDLLPARNRGRYTAWAYTVSYFGLVLLGLLASVLVAQHPLGFSGWRWLFIVGGLGAAIVWFLRRSLPESPRWLESVGREQEADVIVERMEAEARQVTHSDQLPEPHKDEVPEESVAPLRAIFKAPYNRRVAMMLVFHFFEPFSINGFGLLVPLILIAKGFTITNSIAYSAISYIGYPLGSILSVYIAERVERKWLIAVPGIFMIIFGVAFGFSTSIPAIVSFGLIFTLSTTVFTNAFHIYQGELFPTYARATASGISYSISRVSTAILPFILLPLLFRSGPVSVFTVIAIATLIAVADVVFFGPKTTGRPLEYVNPPIFKETESTIAPEAASKEAPALVAEEESPVAVKESAVEEEESPVAVKESAVEEEESPVAVKEDAAEGKTKLSTEPHVAQDNNPSVVSGEAEGEGNLAAERVEAEENRSTATELAPVPPASAESRSE